MEADVLEKFAIIGLGCRMPPTASSLPNFWRFLLRGGNALRPIKNDRWDWRQYFDEDPQRPGKSYAPKAASLDADVQQWDPLVFGISPREAASLDPQQRLLLEVTWEAFEDAGLPIERMSGSATGVFIGGFCLDHLVLQAQPSNRHLVNAHSPGGVMMTVLSNRLSHAFNLKGPSLTLDTACSSSLVALHYACQSLRARECDMVLAGGVNVMTRPDFPIIMSKGHFLSHHGECHAFDESAAGYGRGEGAGILLLKRLEDAIAAGDPIHAIIRGTGVNQDGHTDGISLPNSAAQEALVAEVYRKAAVPPAEVDYVEAHGTGTQAGDTAELRALNVHFAKGRAAGDKLIVGSVKTNIGHLEAAAGVAGVLKAIGVLKSRQVPRNLHFVHPNPKIPFADYCLEVATETRTLPSAEEKPTLYVGVNSFGYGGTNAHILLESAPASSPPTTTDDSDSALRLIPFSARSEEALRDLAGKFAFQIGQGLPGSLSDFAYTTAFRRSHLECRAAALAGNLEELREQMIAASTGQPHEAVVVGAKAVQAIPAHVFVYTGMGPQWWGMGQELIRKEPLVAATIEEIDAHFQSLAGWSLKEAMMANEGASRMARTEVAQPANFALQVALTRLWASYGIRPAAVVGHSVGEVVSACVAGVYTLEEAVRVSYHRSRLQQTAAGLGSMLAVGLPEADAQQRIAGLPSVSIAAINSFSAVTLSGDTAQLKELAGELESAGIFQKFLRVEVAYHSPQMDPLREELLASLAGLSPRSATIPLYSTAYGKIVPAAEWTAEYWWHNVRQPVRFAGAMRQLFEDGFSSFIEIGPHPVLGNSIKECAAHLERKTVCFTSLRRQEPERKRLLLTLGELYCAGADVDWGAVSPRTGRFIPGPQYPWQRQKLWVESERSCMERLGLPGPVYLNRTIAGPRPCWEVEINRNYFPFLFDHGVQNQTVFAGMGYIEAAISLNREVHGKQAVVLENVSFERVLIVDYSKLQYLLTEHDAEGGRFNISSRIEGEEDSVQRHCRGRMLPQSDPRAGKLDLAALKAECPEAVTIEALYERLRRRGLHYGPAFRPIAHVLAGENCFLVKIDASAVVDDEFHPLHPTIFDAALQSVLYCASGEHLFVPFSFDQFQYFSRPETAECYAFGRLLSQTDTRLVADVWLTDAAGNVHAHARHISLQVIDIETKQSEANLFYEPEWKPAPRELQSGIDGTGIFLLADAEDSDLALAKALAERLPGAALAIREANGSRGFDAEEMDRLLAAHAGRKDLVVLWGSGEAKYGAGGVASLNEKTIGLLQALGVDRTSETQVTFVTRGARSVVAGEGIPNLAACALGALGLVAQNEFDSLVCRSVDLSDGEPASCAERIVSEIAGRSRGDTAYRGGERFESVLSARKEEKAAEKFVPTSLNEPLELRSSAKGRLDSLHFEPVERRAPGEGEIELRIHRVALNYKDLLKIEGHIHPIALENTFWGSDPGMECAGVVIRCGPNSGFSPSDRVAAILPRAFRTYATIPEKFVVRIPPSLDMDAAAIPVVYLTAFRGLIDIARLQRGERILIHHGTGGLGLAAIDLAQWIGAEIFSTAGSEEQRQFLRDLGIEHVFPSRDLDFGQQIREATNQEGVDVVIGAQTGQSMHVSLSLLRTGGRYIEVGKKDIAEDHDLPLRAFNRNVIFASVDIDRLALERPQLIQKTLHTVFAHFASGDFKQRFSRALPIGGLREAFEEMGQDRHIGKLCVDLSSGQVDVLDQPKIDSVIQPDGCYLVTGGTSGFGLMTARWMARQGAGKVILVSRSGMQAPGIEDAVRSFASLGTQIEVLSVDVTDPQQVRALVEHAGTAPFALRGIVHGAMVLDDAMMADLTEESFRRVFQPKAGGALNLAEAIENQAGLDFVVFYSSVSALVGNRGQTSYVVANSILDGLALRLRAGGVPAVSINWGALAESGVVARDERLGSVLASAGITGLTDEEALDALEQAIRKSTAQLGVFKVDWSRWHEAHPKLADDPRFQSLRLQARDGGGNDVASRLRGTLADATKEQRLQTLENHLQEVLAAILKMAKDTIAVDRKLNELGVDSLMVLELSLGIHEQIGVSFSAMEFLKGPTLRDLAAAAETKLWPA
ncbi:MAG: SDR family NAD(P)-dependent oxidoreductase [Terrimicrobiaceae bacterium]|nr:SDR family NAD(P)-dependent oxidoreductase [Terrimicrobiaceae bacterium]